MRGGGRWRTGFCCGAVCGLIGRRENIMIGDWLWLTDHARGRTAG